MSFEHRLTKRDILLSDLPKVTPFSFSEYVQQGGYQSLEKAFSTLKPADVLSAVSASGLRGRGGGGFPTARKWEMVASQENPVRYLCVNGAEDEPGTLKDRYLLRSNPHQLIEGAALAAYAVSAQEGYLYVNGHFKEEIQFLEEALREARDQGFLGRPVNGFKAINLRIAKGPGTYVAGEETALLSVIAGGVAKPKEKPPYYPAIHGLFGKPTVVNNIETICRIPHIVRLGTDRDKAKGTPLETMIFTVTGDVLREGLYELPLGTPLRDLIKMAGGAHEHDAHGDYAPTCADEACDKMLSPQSPHLSSARVKALFPGGPSNSILPWSLTDVPMDFDTLKAAGSGLGTGAVIVFSEKRCMVKTAITYASFFSRESCKQCPPCFLGLEKITHILQKIDVGQGKEDDITQLAEICKMVKGRGYCYLLTGGAIAVESILKHFREEFLIHIQESQCPFE